ncbi:hypothetical protein O181_024119 [Austropuccinia psidii MF-1]|uniref:Uncharacterized protein n=1 Tax=Austropuccinia psidii MF-1 TaxID=1389203 RepID=A0A9Q3GZC5_9BASI|nr:hypothetical protein [Austropuccinia psidii MF-1]
MEITLELDTRYHERQKEKGSHKEKKPEISGSNSSKPPQSSSSKKLYHRKNNKGKNFQVSKDKPHASLLTKDKNKLVMKRRGVLKKAYALIVVASTQLKHASRGLKIGKIHQEASLANSPKGEDLILGYDFLYHFNPIPDWKNGLITYYSSHKDSIGIISSTSNDFSTAINSVSVIGELKTTSLPPLGNIPSIIPSQSLLPSRDQVFIEIKDVGEDFAISSLHLFQGDMELPPLSFHSSLEEQWDEEEEPEDIETMLKVVPPSHSQYLDVFSKVKAEELPPYRACDHHIKLEGLLPPVGVIYSLSIHESEKLWVYISENV